MLARGRLLRACLWLLVGCGPESSSEAVPSDEKLDAAIQVDAGAELDAAGDAGGSLPADSGTLDAAQPATAMRLSLVRHPLWTRVAPAEDLFADGPAAISCEASATAAELLGDEQVFSVDTGFCNYVTVHQPALLSIAVGDVVKVRLWHFDLSAPEPAEAHAALTIAGVSVFDERISIPAKGGLLVREIRITRDIPAGAPVIFHLHNHGANSWALVEVSKGPG